MKLTAGPRYKPVEFFTKGPGPADYTVIHKSKSPTFSISPRQDPVAGKNDLRPSPVQYNAVQPKRTSPSFSFTMQQRNQKTTVSPGPATYTTIDQNEKIMFTMREKVKDLEPEILKRQKLGPGTYSSEQKETVHGGYIGNKLKHGLTTNMTLK